jgi:aryl-alcohol dehydrogenase-like predicted oxidoreductase
VYQCHRYDDGTPLEETLRALNDLVQQGKILYYGVSEWTGDQIAQAADIVRDYRLHPIAVNQPQYSLLARGIERDVIPVCEREGIGQVVFSPLAQGVLTGKYKPGQPVPVDSRAADPKQNQFFKTGVLDAYVHDQVPADDKLLERVQRLLPIAQDAGLSMPQLALAWCLRQTNVAGVIIGASRVDQVDQNVSASGKTLSAEVLGQIDEALRFASAPA